MKRIYYLLFLLVVAKSAWAQSDQLNLDDNLGATVEDAYATPYLNKEIQLPVRYDRMMNGKDNVRLEPTVEFGPARNTQVSVSVPVLLGNGDKSGSGNIQAALFYNFFTEGLVLPALALEGRGIFPTGIDANGVDFAIKAIATKSITNKLTRLHVNVEYYRNNLPGIALMEGQQLREREDRWTASIGISQRVGTTSVAIVDFVRQQLRLSGQDMNLIELGLRKQFTRRLVVSGNLGAGIGPYSPLFRIQLGLQRAF